MLSTWQKRNQRLVDSGTRSRLAEIAQSVTGCDQQNTGRLTGTAICQTRELTATKTEMLYESAIANISRRIVPSPGRTQESGALGNLRRRESSLDYANAAISTQPGLHAKIASDCKAGAAKRTSRASEHKLRNGHSMAASAAETDMSTSITAGALSASTPTSLIGMSATRMQSRFTPVRGERARKARSDRTPAKNGMRLSRFRKAAAPTVARRRILSAITSSRCCTAARTLRSTFRGFAVRATERSLTNCLPGRNSAYSIA